MEETKCFQCGCEFVADGVGTGYGTNREGHRICYKCCGKNDKRELESMKIGDKTVLYLSVEDKDLHYGDFGFNGKVMNWPSSYVKNCTFKKGRHNLAGVRYDVWFTEGNNYFHGVRYGRDSEICYVTCVKPY